MVFLRIQRKSIKEVHAKVYDRTGPPVGYRSLAKNSDERLSRIQSILLQIDRSQLTVVYCNRQDNTSKDPFSRCETCKNLGCRLGGRSQRQEHH